jgi:raffinose/stachyose/melibiose transport system substrate-binding protein
MKTIVSAIRVCGPKSRMLIFICLIGIMAAVPATTQAKPAAKTTTVTLWTWSPVPPTMKKMIAAFEKVHPTIHVDFTNYNYSPQYLTALSAAASSGHLPDLVGLQPGSLTQQYRPYLVPLQGYAKQTWGASWRSRFYKVDVNQVSLGNPTADRNIYDMPQESQVINIWYNAQLFNQFHLTVPKTWAQLVNVSQQLSSHGIAPMYQGAADGWQNENVFLMLASQLAPGQVYKAEAGTIKWTSPGLVKAVNAWKKLFGAGVFQVGALSGHAYPDGVSLFTAGRVGMMALGSWWLQEYRYPPPLPPLVHQWAFKNFYLPAVPGSTHQSAPIGGVDVAIGMTKNAKNRSAAWQVIKSWIAGEAEQQALNDLNDLPAFKGFAPTIKVPAAITGQYHAYLGVLDRTQNQRFVDPRISTALDDALAGVAAGKVSASGGLSAVQQATNKVLGHS